VLLGQRAPEDWKPVPHEVASARVRGLLSGTAVLVVLLALVLLSGCSSGARRANVAPSQGVVVAANHLSSACAEEFFQPRAKPKPIATPLQAGVLARFAIFRRAALPGDEPAASQLPPGGLGRQLYNEDELASYYPAYVRRLGTLSGRRYYVVPAFAQVKMAFAECSAPRSDRALQIQQRHRRAVDPLYCLIEVPERKGTTVGCEPFAAINLSARVFGASDFLGKPIIELVPDGVAAVRIAYRAHARLMVAVRENAFAFTPPPPPPSVAAVLQRLFDRAFAKSTTAAQQRTGAIEYDKRLLETDPTRIEWLNHAGDVVRTIEPPTTASLEATSIGGTRAPIGG
jgi:hypothetical protein